MNIFKYYITRPVKSTISLTDLLSGREKINEILKPPSRHYYAKFGLTKHGEEMYATS